MEKEVLRLENIVKIYKIGTIIVEALRSVSLVVKKNEFVALMGPSGSGKSTLMNILGCLDTPTSGNYFLNGEDVSKLDDNALAEIRNRQIGFVFQTFNLLPRSTALENVMLPLIYAGVSKNKRIEIATKTMTEVKLGDRMEHKPNELSGGQRQRVAIARALINRPAIILADEPTGNLDSKTSIEILGLLEDIHKMGNTVIIVTHEEDIAEHAHRIIRLMDGKISTDEPNTKIKTISDYHFNGI
ncbi:MAG: ABC transporter ATP-binding protein [Bacteroidales bacterium]|nr:ABC transporter ATP-binding protein [Bacteroidales bacterium]MDD4604527.1 ABC transporter ATP-binding protein [Bacteroidales bacterium]